MHRHCTIQMAKVARRCCHLHPDPACSRGGRADQNTRRHGGSTAVSDLPTVTSVWRNAQRHGIAQFVPPFPACVCEDDRAPSERTVRLFFFFFLCGSTSPIFTLTPTYVPALFCVLVFLGGFLLSFLLSSVLALPIRYVAPVITRTFLQNTNGSLFSTSILFLTRLAKQVGMSPVDTGVSHAAMVGASSLSATRRWLQWSSNGDALPASRRNDPFTMVGVLEGGGGLL